MEGRREEEKEVGNLSMLADSNRRIIQQNFAQKRDNYYYYYIISLSLYFRFFASSTWIYAFLRFLRFEIFQPAYIRIFGIKGVAYSSAVVSSRDEQVLFYFQSRSLLPRVKLLSHS